VLKLVNLIDDKEVQPEKALSIVVTNDTSKLFKSKEVNA
jgi:hypothetical protein